MTGSNALTDFTAFATPVAVPAKGTRLIKSRPALIPKFLTVSQADTSLSAQSAIRFATVPPNPVAADAGENPVNAVIAEVRLATVAAILVTSEKSKPSGTCPALAGLDGFANPPCNLLSRLAS